MLTTMLHIRCLPCSACMHACGIAVGTPCSQLLCSRPCCAGHAGHPSWVLPPLISTPRSVCIVPSQPTNHKRPFTSLQVWKLSGRRQDSMRRSSTIASRSSAVLARTRSQGSGMSSGGRSSAALSMSSRSGGRGESGEGLWGLAVRTSALEGWWGGGGVSGSHCMHCKSLLQSGYVAAI